MITIGKSGYTCTVCGETYETRMSKPVSTLRAESDVFREAHIECLEYPLRKPKQHAPYWVASEEEKKGMSVYGAYSLLLGPDGFECLLGEPEDCTWSRDGNKVVAELNRLYSALSSASVK